MSIGRFTGRFFKSVRADNGKEKGGTPESDRQKAKSKMNVAHFHAKSNVIADNAVGKWLADSIASSKRLPVDQLHSIVVDVTPALAREILDKCNYDNRGLRKARVGQYAKAMAGGRWKLTSQGISISRHGQLNNGQHRLEAIVLCGETVPMLVTFGEDRSVFDILDTSAARGPSDALKIAGFKNTSSAAAAARILMMIENGNAGANATFGNDQVLGWVTRNPTIQDYAAHGGNIGRKLKTSKAGLSAALFLIGTKSKNPALLEMFQASLSHGTNLNAGDPILVLREGLRNRDFVGRIHPGIASSVVCAVTIKAWNLWVKGKKARISSLTWGTSETAGEAFPEVR